MSKMRVFVLLLTTLILFSLWGCADSTDKINTNNETSSTTKPESNQPSAETPKETLAADQGFLHSNWGDSMEEVFENEGKDGCWLLEKTSEYAGLPCVAFLMFEKEDYKLQSGYYEFRSPTMDAKTKYETVKKYLDNLYQAQNEVYYDSNDNPLNNLDEAIANAGSAAATWRITEESTLAYLYLRENGEVVLAFQSLPKE